MIIFTQSNYITEVVTVVNSQLEPILRDRLRYSTESVSTTIYMADKIGIDQILRLAALYMNAMVIDPFPISKDAYQLYSQSKLSDPNLKIYNAGVTCNGELPEDQYPLTQLKHIWEQSILLGLGRNRDVFAERVIFLYDDTVCVYPAQNLDYFSSTPSEWMAEEFYSKVESEKYYISRDNKDYFRQSDSNERYTTYWAAIRGKNEEKVGAIGLQLS